LWDPTPGCTGCVAHPVCGSPLRRASMHQVVLLIEPSRDPGSGCAGSVCIRRALPYLFVYGVFVRGFVWGFMGFFKGVLLGNLMGISGDYWGFSVGLSCGDFVWGFCNGDSCWDGDFAVDYG